MNLRRASGLRARVRAGRANGGFTLIEVLFALVLSSMIISVVAAGLITALNVSRSTTAQVAGSTDAGLISSFLIRDAQSAGGIDPTTTLPFVPALGVSTNSADLDGSACMVSARAQGVVAPLVVRFSWIDRTSATANTNVVFYALDLSTKVLTRYLCTNGAFVVSVVLGRNINSATPTCQYESLFITQPYCAGHPTFVSLALVGKGTPPFAYTLKASLRTAASLMAIMLPTKLEDGQLGVPYASAVMTTIGSSAQTKWTQTGLPAGLNIDLWTGMVYGTPAPLGPYPFTSTVKVTVNDVLFATAATRIYTIVIHAPPVAVANSYSLNEDTPYTATVANSVLINDYRREGNPVSPVIPTKATLASGVAHGALVFNANGTFTYSPALNYNGPDSFTYRANDTYTASDGSTVAFASAAVLVTLTVSAVNDAPVNQVPVTQETPMNTPEVFSNASNLISISDVDAGGANVKVNLSATNGNITLSGIAGLTFSGGANGTSVMTFTGTIAAINTALNRLTFTPNSGFTGPATLQITTDDQGNTGGAKLTDMDTVTINVTSLGIFTAHGDVGDVTVPTGSTNSSYTSPTYTVSGSGWDIWEANDGFQFIYRPMTGDGSVTARVVSETVTYSGGGNNNPNCYKKNSTQTQLCTSVAKSGVMFRQNLTSVSALDAAANLTKGNGSEFIYRTTAGATTDAASPGDSLAVPYWVRLIRSGNQITAQISSNGTTWTQRGTTQTVAFGLTTPIYVGLAVSAVNQLSGDDRAHKLNTATFDNVSINTPPTALADSYSVNQYGTLTVPASTGVLANDSDPESNSLTAQLPTGPAHGTLSGFGTDGRFTYTPNPDYFGTDSFTYAANDGIFNSTATVTITVKPGSPVNAMPSFATGPNQTIRANLGVQTGLPVPWATNINAGAGDTGQLVDFIVTNNNNSLFSVQPSISADGTLTYAPAPAAADWVGAHGTAIVSVVIHDNGGTANGGVDTSAVQTFTITIVAPPVLTATSANLIVAENALPTVLDPGITATDADSTNIASVTVTITTPGYVNGQDVLAFVNQNGITGTWTAATGVLALAGTTTVANYQTALRSITYANISDNPGPLRTVTFVASDGDVAAIVGNTTSKTIAVTAINDGPVNSIPGAQTTTTGVATLFSSANGNPISISDPDAGSAAMQVQLIGTNGTVSLSGTTGLNFTVGDGAGDATMTFTGTIAAVNAALAGMSFTPTPAYNGPANLAITTSDQGNTGSGGTLTDSDTVTITVLSSACPDPINGWQGQYYANATLSGTVPALCRDDPAINFNWGGGAPDPALPSDQFSVRWTKAQTFTAGSYKFTMGSDDGSRLLIDGVNVLNNWGDQGYPATPPTVVVALTAASHTIVMEYYENGGAAAATLTWVAVTPPPAPTLAFSAFTNTFWSGAGSTVVYFRPAATGSFTTTANAIDAVSGIASYGFPALGGVWASTAGALGVNTYSWSGTPAAPGTKNVTATNGAGLTSAPSPFTLAVDSTPPTGDTVSYADGLTSATSATVSFVTGTDPGGSGIGTRLLQRRSAPLGPTSAGNTCGAWSAFTTIATNPPPTPPLTSPFVDPVTSGNCYQYQYVVADNVGNVDVGAAATGTNTVKVKSYAATIAETSGLINYWRLGEATTSLDSFAGTAGATLVSRSGEIGATWTRHPVSSGDAVITTSGSGRIRKDGLTTGALYFSSAQPASADYTVEADVYVASRLTNDMIGIVGRLDSANLSSATTYAAVYHADAQVWGLFRYVNNAATLLGYSSTAQPLTDGRTYRLALDMSGSTIRVLVDGVQQFSVVDAQPITGAGRGGIILGFNGGDTAVTDASGMQLDNFRVTPPLADSKGTNSGDYLSGPILGAPGAIANDSNTAATFDGVNDYGTVARSISDNFSIEFWFKSSSPTVPGGNCTGGFGRQWWEGSGLVDAEVNGSQNDFGVSLCPDGTVSGGASGGVEKSVFSPGQYKDAKWHQVVFTRTFASGALRLYVDGALVASDTGSANVSLNAPSAINFGRKQSGSGYFQGSLDEVAIYSTVLDLTTVTAHYIAGKP